MRLYWTLGFAVVLGMPVSAPGRQVIQAPVEEKTPGPAATATPPETVQGIVVDAFGAPVGGSRVRMALPREPGPSQASSRPAWATATSDARGRIALRGVPLGEKLPWVAELDGYRRSKGVWGGESLLQVVLERAPAVSGRVLDPDSAPVEGASITVGFLEGPKKREIGRLSVRSAADGSFSFWRMERGEARVSVRVRGFLPRQVPLEAEGGEARDERIGDIRLSRGRTLTGRAYEKATGAALPGVDVMAWFSSPGSAYSPQDLQVATDEGGRFELSGLPPEGSLTLTATKAGFATTHVAPATGVRSVEVPMEVGGRISGTVCAEQEERESLRVSIRFTGSQAPDESVPVDAVGRFASGSLSSGTFELARQWRLSQSGGYFTTSAPEAIPVVVDGSGGQSTVTIGCHGFAVDGRVRDAADRVVPRLPLWLGAAGGTGLTRADGSFRILVPAAGAYKAESLGPGSISQTPCDSFPAERPGPTCELVLRPSD